MRFAHADIGRIASWLATTAVVLGTIHLFSLQTICSLGLSVDREAVVQVFWARGDEPYTENRSVRVRVAPPDRDVSFRLADLGRIDRLRIDPEPATAAVTLSAIRLENPRFRTIRLDAPETLERVTALNDIAGISRHANGLTVSASGSDPQLELAIEPRRNPAFYGVHLFALLFAVLWLFHPGHGGGRRGGARPKNGGSAEKWSPAAEALLVLAALGLFWLYAGGQFRHTIAFLKSFL